MSKEQEVKKPKSAKEVLAMVESEFSHHHKTRSQVYCSQQQQQQQKQKQQVTVSLTILPHPSSATMNLLLKLPTIAVSLVLFFYPAEAFLSPSFTQRRIISLNQSPLGDYMIFNQLIEDSAAQGASSVSSSSPNKKATSEEDDTTTEQIKQAFESTNPANEGIPPPSANIGESEDVVQEEKKKEDELKPEERRFDPLGFWTPHSSQF